MKKVLLAVFLFTVCGRAQAIRFDSQALTTNAQCQVGSLCPVLAVPGAVASFYTSATLTTPATTYTSYSASSQCPAYAQVTLPGSLSCTTASDSAGNFGVWIGAGTWYYTLTYPASAGGGTKGPYAFTAGASGILAAGVDGSVQYNKAGQFAGDSNITWSYNIGTLFLTATCGTCGNLVLNNTVAGGGSGIYLQNQGIYEWYIVSNGTAVNFQDLITFKVPFQIANGAAGNINFSPEGGGVYFNGNPGTPVIITTNGSYILSNGGFLSNVNSWQAFNSASDGALLRGYGVAPNAANNGGGYIDIAPITYNPNNGGSCVDSNGNPVQQPVPLNGLSSFGTTDTIMWVTQSPQMPPGGSCGAILPINEDWGLAINSYLFARGGLATDNARYNAINTIYLSGGVPSGGVEANTIIAGTLYPTGTATTTGTLLTPTYLGGHMIMGHSTTDPAAGTIATQTNPLSTGEGLLQGMFYFNDTSGHPKYYNGSAWIDWTGGGGGGCTPGGVNKSVQINNGSGGCTGDNLFTYTSGTSVSLGNASFDTVGTTAGFDATTCTAFNCVQAPLGGLYGKLYSLLETAAPTGAGAGGANVYADSTTHMLTWSENGGSFYTLGAYSGAITSGHCVSFNISGGVTALVDAGGACTTGGGGGTVASSSVNQVAVYTAATTVTGSAGLTFNPTTGVLLVGGGSGPGITMTSFSLTAAGVMQLTAAGSNIDLTAATAYNALQAPAGGMYALSFTASNYIQPGSYSTTIGSGPPLTTSDTFHAGALSYYSGSSGGGPCLVMYNGSTWACLSGGGGSGTVTSALQNQVAVYPANGTTVQGYSAFTIINSTTTLTVIGTGIITTGAFNSSAAGVAFVANGGAFTVNGAAGSSSVPQMSISGYIASTGSTGGLNVTTNTAAASIQTIGGINACNASSCLGGTAYAVAGTPIVTSTLGASFSTLTLSGLLSSSAAIYTSVGINVTTCTLTNCIQSVGGIQSTGTAAQNGGFAVTSDTAVNSIQTVGGINSCISAGCISGIAYEVAGTKLIDSSRNAFVNNITISGTCTGCSSAAVNSITGTANQVLANGTSGSAQTGAVTLTLPQSIGTGSSVTFAGLTVSGGSTFTGGIVTGSSSNSAIYIGSTGNFYNRPLGGLSTGVSCSGIPDGWTAVSSDDYVVVCLGGARYRAALSSY